MTGKFKILILLVALVALPLRGMAAVAMWHCAQGTASESADGHAGHHEHDQGAGHSHEASSHKDSAENPASPAATSCSACAACCMGGTIAPTAWSAFSFAPIGASRIAFVERSFTGVVPAQLERPPLAQTL